jgi:hypothetical protein
LRKIAGSLDMLVQTVSDFDRLTIRVVDETLRSCLGETNTYLIYNYLEKQGYQLNEIPREPEKFSEELRNILGFGSRQILCAPSILEESILEIICKKLGVTINLEKPVNFPKHIRKLRASCKSS